MTSNYYSQQSTNFQSNPFSKNKFHSKQHLIEDFQSKFQQDNSNTLNFNDIQLPSKIVFPTDQQITMKAPKKQSVINNKTQNNNYQFNLHLQKGFHQIACASNQHNAVNIPVNKKVQQILIQDPLRQKYLELLPQAYKKRIGHDHTQLIKIMGFIDNTIQFIAQNRSLKFIFFQDLKRQIKDSLRIIISLNHIQQILFLEESIYEVRWEFNQSKRAYDLQIILNKIQSKDQRKTTLRKKIIQFLTLQQKKQFSEIQSSQQNILNWRKGFEPQRYQIPLKSLPIHPLTKSAQIRGLEQTNMSKIQNSNLKQLMIKKKEQSQVGSLKSNEVLQKIFNKKKNTLDISKKILQAVKEKEKKLEEIKNCQLQIKVVVNKAVMKDLCQEVMLIYISKGVGNMFKVGLMQLLKGRTKYSNEQIQKNLDFIISLKEVCYLKQIITSNKSTIIQINKSKMKEVLQKIQNLSNLDEIK